MLTDQNRFHPNRRMNKPLLILLSGTALTGKSTLAKFMKEIIEAQIEY